MTLYLDVSAKRIQSYLARTPTLRGRRGASALLDHDRILDWTKPAWEAHGVENATGKRTDGQLSVQLAPTTTAVVADDIARDVAVLLHRLAPAAEWEVQLRSGSDYRDALEAGAAARRAGRDRIGAGSSGVIALPTPPADVPMVRFCQACGLAPAVVAAARIDPGDATGVAICADCAQRYLEGGHRTDRRQWSRTVDPKWAEVLRPGGLAAERALRLGVEEAIGRPIGVVDGFGELAAVGGPDANHLATVFVDGNRFGDLFASLKQTRVNLGELSEDLAAAVNAALVDATVAVTRDGDKYLPVVPHLVGGDDLLASVTADRAWEFVTRLLVGYGERTAALARTYGEKAKVAIAAPTASAGIVFAHAKRPFADSVELAESALRRAKSAHKAERAAVCWIDVTADGPDLSDGRCAPSLEDLLGRRAMIDAVCRLPAAGRARLAAVAQDDVAVAALARRLGRADLTAPFLLPNPVMTLADALTIERHWPWR
ncbi:Cas10/Cmr2 second palm domain-containing protein [Pseudonocardia oroxyli]|uniref:Cas10/Cmr2 second palm domain-containing protein n=1 Tax=Pseudonocardia oroxyli TaxID=366584 RepID=A0A1G8CQY7_PSEOR|nr:hypothetical protein [Pseudonocardia oroxyli]SDH47599.1 hypothetical protein SAMN05216377_12328 [Pseudonocardia oroxyli]